MAETLIQATAAAILVSGLATRYDPMTMDAVVANRILYGQIPDQDEQPWHKGYVALLDCDHLGRLVWLEQGDRVDGPYLVADCAAAQDRDRLMGLGWAVDLSWEVAVEWGVLDDVGRGFCVYDRDPRQVMLSGPLDRAAPR